MMNNLGPLHENEILTILCIEVALMMLGIGLVSPVLPQYAHTFGVNITLVGLIITAFGIARIIVDIPAGALTNRWGRRPVLVMGPLIQGISSIGCGLAVNYGMLLCFRFLQGIGSAMYTTAAIVMLADISTPANRGRLMSYYQGSLLLGSGLGPTMGGFIAQYFGLAALSLILIAQSENYGFLLLSCMIMGGHRPLRIDSLGLRCRYHTERELRYRDGHVPRHQRPGIRDRARVPGVACRY